MQYFRLDPAKDFMGHAVWGNSKTTDPCWVMAETERDARIIASSRPGIAMSNGGTSKNNPWENLLLVKCVVDPPPLGLNGRSLITAAGDTYF
jgi:hypothetical protein